MWNGSGIRFKSGVILVVAICMPNNAQPPHNLENSTILNWVQEEAVDQNHFMIEFISNLFCVNDAYRFNHIYVERSLKTDLADKLISRINDCMTAGLLVSR